MIAVTAAQIKDKSVRENNLLCSELYAGPGSFNCLQYFEQTVQFFFDENKVFDRDKRFGIPQFR